MKKITSALVLAAISGTALTSLRAEPAAPPPVVIDASRLAYVRSIDPRYQSFQIGFSHLTGGETWKAYDALPKGETKDIASVREARAASDLMNRRLLNLTRALSPLYIRYSGTTANSVYFHDSDTPPPAKAPEGYTVVLTRERWKLAVDFAKAVDARVLTSFANSDGVRDAAHAWTPRMAKAWLRYNRSIGARIYAAELFNEPNAPEPPRIPKGFTPEEFARDFAIFRGFMSRAAPAIKIAGPGNATLGITGVPSIGASMEGYASASPRPRFDIFSYHFYPTLAQRCAPPTSPLGLSADKALSEEFLARPEKQLNDVKALRDKYAPGAPIWLTETGGAACGGLIWQPTFLDSFRFLDTEARLAKGGLDAMFTHALISGSNGIIDEKTFMPNSSYWGAVLFRRLMGTRVLDAQASRPGLHVYAHCLRETPGGVVLLALNLGSTPQTVNAGMAAQVYALTAPELQGRTVMLNGKTLAIGNDDRLPPMPPVAIASGKVVLSPTSSAFIALPGARNRNCYAAR